MHNRQNDILSSIFQSCGFAFRIVGPGSGCLDADDVVRQFITEAIQSYTRTKLKKLHCNPILSSDAIANLNRSFGSQFELTAVRHSRWRKLNREVTRINRLSFRWLN